MVATRAVNDAGFVALEVDNAEEAVALLEFRADISLPFTHINMPGTIDGLKPAHAVHDR